MVVKKFLLILVLLLGLAFFLVKYQTGTPKVLETPIPSSQSSTEKSEVKSADGSIKLSMTVKKQDTASVYSFSVIDQTGMVTPLFEKKATLGETMSLPLNAWSPNNKHLFIEDHIGSRIDYLVFNANAALFPNGDKYLNATDLFNQKVKNYNLKAITGWDDPVLMSVRTINGPHFWFDITTQSFIQLFR